MSDPGDLYSGLVGPILIYRSGILSSTSNDIISDTVDAEFILNFMVYNENLSPYMYRNIETYAPELMDRLIKIKDESVLFEMGGDTWPESNLMHSINGRMYGNLNGLVELISLFFNLFILGYPIALKTQPLGSGKGSLARDGLWNGSRSTYGSLAFSNLHI